MSKQLLCTLAIMMGVANATSSAKATLAITGGTTTQNFNGLTATGTNLAALADGADGWKVLANDATPTFAEGSSTLGNLGNSTSYTTGGSYNFGGTGNADRAIGFLGSGGASGTSPLTIMVKLENTTALEITDLSLAWDYEKYRSGSRAWSWTFFGSTDGTTWSALTSGDQSYVADANNTVYGTPISSTAKSINVALASNLAASANYYLRWSLNGNLGSTNGQGLGIDNFSVSATFAAVPEPTAFLYGGVIVSGICAWRFRQKRRLEQVLI